MSAAADQSQLEVESAAAVEAIRESSACWHGVAAHVAVHAWLLWTCSTATLQWLAKWLDGAISGQVQEQHAVLAFCRPQKTVLYMQTVRSSWFWGRCSGARA